MTRRTSRYRILVVSEHRMFSEGLALALSRQGHDVHIGAWSGDRVSGGRAAGAVGRTAFDAAMLDTDVAGGSEPLGAITTLARAGSSVVVFTSSEERAQWGGYLRAGARKVLGKDVALTEVLGTVRRLSDGLAVQDAAERQVLLREWSASEDQRSRMRDRVATLTSREQLVLGELMRGHPVAEIARMYVVSPATVRTQVKNVLAKLEVGSQLAAVAMAYQVRWQPPASQPAPALASTA